MEQPGDRFPLQVSCGHKDNPNNEVTICGLLSYSDGNPGEMRRFKRNCDELQSALRIGATNGEHITVVDKDKVQPAFFSLLLQWENEIFTTAALSFDQENAHTFSFETTYDIVQHIYWIFKRLNAYSNIIQRREALISSNRLSQIQKDEDKYYIWDILCSVEQRWRRVSRAKGISEEKVQLLSALTSLWTPVVDTFAESSGTRKLLHKIIGNIQLDERLTISKRHAFHETTKMDADKFFAEWVYSRGISCNGDKGLSALMPLLKDDLEEVFGVVSNEVINRAVNNLRRLGDRTFWFHFSGHHGNDGIQCIDKTIPSLQNILQAAGYVLSNVVVTIDCSYADTLVKNFRFVVDSSVEYSGLTVISSSSSEYKSPVNSCFTSLLAMALCSATFTCLRPVDNPCQDDCVQQEAECFVCKKFSKKCEVKGTISITKIFRCIKDHFPRSRKPTVRRHYASRQLPVARFKSNKALNRITFLPPNDCDKCCNLYVKVNEKRKFSMKKARKMAFLRLLQLSHTTCLKHCEAARKAKAFACRLFNYVYSTRDEDYLRHMEEYESGNLCNCATLVQEMLEYSPTSYQGNFSIQDFNKPYFEFKRTSMLRFNMTFKQNGSPAEQVIITNHELFMTSLSDGILLELNTADTTG